MAWSGGDAGKQDSSSELTLDVGLERVLKSSLEILTVNSFHLSLESLFFFLELLLGESGFEVELDLALNGGFGVLDSLVVVEQVALEGVGIDLDDGVFDEGFGSDEFVVGRVVDDVNDLALSGDLLRDPDEVSGVEGHASEFVASSPDTENSHITLVAELGVGNWASLFEGSLLLVNWHTSSCKAAFVA